MTLIDETFIVKYNALKNYDKNSYNVDLRKLVNDVAEPINEHMNELKIESITIESDNVLWKLISLQLDDEPEDKVLAFFPIGKDLSVYRNEFGLFGFTNDYENGITKDIWCFDTQSFVFQAKFDIIIKFAENIDSILRQLKKSTLKVYSDIEDSINILQTFIPHFEVPHL